MENQVKQKPYLSVSVELKTEFAQEYHKKYGGQLIGALASIDYYTTVTEKGKKEALDWKERTQNILLGNIRKTSETLNALIESSSLHGVEPTFPGRKEVDINMKNPATRVYIEWLQKIDKTASEIETLWIMGVIDSNQKKKAFNQISYATMLFSRTARNFINKAKNSNLGEVPSKESNEEAF